MVRDGEAGERTARTWAAIAAFAAIVSGADGAQAGCGDYNADGAVGASDALGVLQTAVGSRVCDKVRCDVDGNGTVTGSDALIVLKNAVGGSIAWSCPAVTISSIDDLPLATGPVDGGAGLGALLAGASLVGGAETGINFSSLGADTFDQDSSMAACEVGNVTKAALNEAAQGDMILCYVQAIFAGIEEPGLDIYDGEFHTFALDFGDAPAGDDEHGGGPSLVRLRLVRDADTGTITDFELFACGDGVGADVQTEYIRQTIDGPDFEMTAMGVHDGGEGGRTVTVGGSLGDDGGFTGRKTVSVRFAHSAEAQSGHGATELVQGADEFTLDGYDTGTFTSEQDTGTFARQVHAEAELIDANVPGEPYDISLLAMGHGAAKTFSQGSAGWGEWELASIEGWNGDTTRVDDDAAAVFLGAVSEAELTEIGAASDVTFEGDSAWDCSGTPEMSIEVDQLALDSACEDLRFGWEWVNCYDIIQPEPPACEGEHCGEPCADCGPPCEGAECEPPAECWDETCTCDPKEPACMEACWDPQCGDPPCYGPDCGFCEGPDCGPPPECWDDTCTCDPQEPACMEECWNFECGDPPCDGPDCEP